MLIISIANWKVFKLIETLCFLEINIWLEHNKFRIALKPKDILIDSVNLERFLTRFVGFSIFTLLRTRKGSGQCDLSRLKDFWVLLCYVSNSLNMSRRFNKTFAFYGSFSLQINGIFIVIRNFFRKDHVEKVLKSVNWKRIQWSDIFLWDTSCYITLATFVIETYANRKFIRGEGTSLWYHLFHTCEKILRKKQCFIWLKTCNQEVSAHASWFNHFKISKCINWSLKLITHDLLLSKLNCKKIEK